MNIDFSQELKDLKGEAFRQGDLTKAVLILLNSPKESYTKAEFAEIANNAPALTLGNACIEALSASYQDEQALSRVDKIKRGRLAEKIYGQVFLDIENSDVVLCQAMISKYYSNPVLVMRADDMLEGKG